VWKWIERVLLLAALAIGGSCATVLYQSHRADRIKPPLIITERLPEQAEGATAARLPLPGDNGTAGTLEQSIGAPPRGAWVARIHAPTVKLSATVLEGTDDATLNRAAGHIEDTPLPGQPGNAGIAGHRDRHFRPLRNVHAGDPIDVTTRAGVFHYRVSRTLIVGPEDVQVLDATPRPTLTLVTCYPFDFIGHAPKRFIVQAELENGGAGRAGAGG
jgi:LPXTG-site transpeptidase (sortase) family protein